MWDADFKMYLVTLGGPSQSTPNGLPNVARIIRPMTEPFRLYLAEVKRSMKDARTMNEVSAWPLRLLLSYFYFADTDFGESLDTHYAGDAPDLFLDSGAYSAWTQGDSIDVEAYGNFLHRWKHRATVYATLDVVGDGEETRKNTLLLRERGLDPLDVFHVGEDWSNLERMCEERNYVGLGGMVPYASARSDLRAWLAKCFKVAERVTARKGEEVRFHGFGMTRWRNIRDFPWRSVDSSSWGSGFRYGQIPLFDPERGRWFQYRRNEAKAASKLFKHNRLLQKYYGVSAGDLVIRQRWHRNVVCALAGMSYVYMEAWINARREGKGLAVNLSVWPGSKKDGHGSLVGGPTQWRTFANLMSGSDPRVAKETEGSKWQREGQS